PTHFRGIQAVVQQTQQAYEFCHRVAARLVVGDARVRRASMMEDQKIVVLSDDDATLAICEGQVLFIGGFTQINVDRKRDVETSTAESSSQPAIGRLIKVKSNHVAVPDSRAWRS